MMLRWRITVAAMQQSSVLRIIHLCSGLYAVNRSCWACSMADLGCQWFLPLVVSLPGIAFLSSTPWQEQMKARRYTLILEVCYIYSPTLVSSKARQLVDGTSLKEYFTSVQDPGQPRLCHVTAEPLWHIAVAPRLKFQQSGCLHMAEQTLPLTCLQRR